MVGNPNCKKKNHVWHLCALKDCGLDEKDNQGYGKLIGDPQFKCEVCGLTANKAENLCNPQKI